MVDYTPSADEVRDAYAGHDFDQAIASAQFNRWLARERAQAKREALLGAADALNAELGANAANPAPKYITGWLNNRAAKIGEPND